MQINSPFNLHNKLKIALVSTLFNSNYNKIGDEYINSIKDYQPNNTYQ